MHAFRSLPCDKIQDLPSLKAFTKDKQDVFVKHECPRNGQFLRNVTFIFHLDLCR